MYKYSFVLSDGMDGKINTHLNFLGKEGWILITHVVTNFSGGTKEHHFTWRK